MSLELWDFALSGQWPTQELAGGATPVAFSDDFNRANGAVGNGWAYTYGGPAQISGNAVTTTTSAGLVRDLGSKDVDFSFDVTNANAANNIYFYLRAPAADGSMYYVTVATTSITVTKRSRPTPGGSLTDTVVATVTGLVAGYNTGTNIWRFVMSGQSLQVYKGGVLALSTSALGADFAEMSTYFGIDLNSASVMTIDNFTSSSGGPHATVSGGLGVVHSVALSVPTPSGRKITETFNSRADNSTLDGTATETGGATWSRVTAFSNSPYGLVVGGKLYTGVGIYAADALVADLQSASQDITFDVDFSSAGFSAGLQVWFRYTDTTHCYVLSLGRFSSPGKGIYLQKNQVNNFNPGAGTTVATYNVGTDAPTGTYRVVVDASLTAPTIKVYYNGSLVITYTDSSASNIPTGTSFGFYSGGSGLSNDHQTIDNIVADGRVGVSGVATCSASTVKLLRGLSAGKVTPTVDTTTTAAIDNNTGAATLTWSHTCASGANALVVAVGQNTSPDAVQSVTYGGTALTRINGFAGAVGAVALYLLKNPPSGAANIVVTVTGPPSSGIVPCVATSFFNASGVGTTVGGNIPNFGNLDLTPSTGVGDLALLAAYYRGSFTLGTGLSEEGHILTSLSPGAVMAHKTGVAGTTTVSISAGSNGAVLAAALVGTYSVSGTAAATGTLGKKVFLTTSLAGQATVTPTIRRLVPVAGSASGAATFVVALKRTLGLTNISQLDSPASVGGPNSLSLGSSAWAYDFTPSQSMQVTQIDIGIVAVTPGAPWYRIGLATTAVHDGSHSAATVPWLLRNDATNAYGDANPANPNAAQTLTVTFTSPVSLTAGTTYSIVVVQSATQGGAVGGNNASSISSGTSATYSGLTASGPIYNGATLSTPLASQYGPHFTLHSFTPLAGTAGVATVTSALKPKRGLVASASGTTTLTSVLRETHGFTTTTIQGVATTTGTPSLAKPLSATTIAGTTTISPTLRLTRALISSTITGVAHTYAQPIYIIPPADFPVTHTPLHITGVIYDLSGEPVSGATVKLFRQADDFMCQSTTSAVDGTYSFDRDPYDPYLYYVLSYTTVASIQVHGTSDRDLVPV